MDNDEYCVSGPSILPLHTGPNYDVEDETEDLLAEDRRLMRATGQEIPYLTFDQLMLRRNREIVGPYGVPDRHQAGIYRRAFNPMRGERPVGLRQGDE